MHSFEIQRNPEVTFLARIRDIRNVTWPEDFNTSSLYFHDIALVGLPET